MTPKARPSSSGPRRKLPAGVPVWGLEALWAVALWLTLYFWVQPHWLYYQADAAVFHPAPFTPGELVQPGRLFWRMLAWGIHACQFPALGATLGTLLIWFITAAAGRLFWRGPGGRPRLAHWVLAPPLLAVLGRYDEGGAALVLGWAWALGLAAAAAWLASRGGLWRWLAPAVGAAVVYVAAGGGPLCAYAILALLAAGLTGRWWAAEHLVLLVAVAAGVGVEVWLLGKAWPRWWEPWIRPAWAWPAALQAGVFAVVALIAARLAAVPTPPTRTSPAPVKKKGGEQPVWPLVFWVAGLAAGIILMVVMRDDARRATLQLRALALAEKWPEFLALARQQTHLEPETRLELALALHHTGRLLDDWFAYPVVRQDEFLPNIGHGPPAYAVMSRAMLALGQVNHAERYAAEALEILGPRPELLWVLAQVNVLKGHPVAAANFLRVLERQPFHAPTARRWLAELSRDPQLSEEPRLRVCRALMVTTDYPHPDNPTSPLMQQLLHTNPTNRMALEFLLAHDLLTLQLDKLMDHAGRLRDARLGYAALPRHLAEAALLWGSINKSAVADVAGFPLDPALRQRFARFDEIVRAHVQNVEAVRPRLAAEFGDTYWYYYIYGQSGRWKTAPAAVMP
ncbi:MAG: DUF6057 family protein [Verrucomicrobiae bacterium]|nr:DUF6057 family protein [Verrucomicrobiae bacterium]